MKHTNMNTRTHRASFFLTMLSSAFLLCAFSACSNGSVDVAREVEDALTETVNANSDRAVSLEGKTLISDEMQLRFVGAHTAYVTMYDSFLSTDENRYRYSATPATLTLEMEKICAPDGSGVLLSKDDYIAFWNSESFKRDYITSDIASYYVTETTTVTALDRTVYTYVNKTSFGTDSDGNSTVTRTTSATSASSGSSTATALFTDQAGYTQIESEYSASEFTNVVTVTVYKGTTVTNADGESVTTYEADTDKAQSLVGAAIGDTETAYGSDDTNDAAALIGRTELFELCYAKVSADDWYLVEAAFKPYSYTYTTDATLTKTYVDDDNTSTDEEVAYDYVFTQHYTDFGNALFAGEKLLGVTGAIGIALFGYSYDGFMLFYTIDADGNFTETETPTMFHLASIDVADKTMTFYEFQNVDVDVDEDDLDDSTATGTISANYTLTENGDDSTLTLTFETQSGSFLSGKTIELPFYAVEFGANVVAE